MESKHENRQAIKIILIGEPDQKNHFFNEVNANKNSPLAVDIDFIIARDKERDYQIFDMCNQDSILACNHVKNADAIIYFNPTPKLKTKFEQRRDPKKCIAIDFNKVGLKPQELINQMDIFISDHANTLDDISINLQRARFFFSSSSARKMDFYLHKELTHSICNLMVTTSSFLDLTVPRKPIYIATPPARQQSSEIQSSEIQPSEIQPSDNTCAIS